jgi:hypothetical protein
MALQKTLLRERHPGKWRGIKPRGLSRISLTIEEILDKHSGFTALALSRMTCFLPLASRLWPRASEPPRCGINHARTARRHFQNR